MHTPDAIESVTAPSDDQYRQIVESAVDYAIVSCDLDGRVTSWNGGATTMFGWASQDIVGQSVERLFTPADVAAGVAAQHRRTALAEGRALDDRWHMRKDGSRFWGSGELMLLRGDDDETTGFVKIVRDRTEERREAAGRRQLSMDLRFLARASEELAELCDYQTTLDKVARLSVPDFADWCAVDILEPGNVLNRVATAHVDPRRLARAVAPHGRYLPDPESRFGVWEVLRTGQARLVEEMTPELQQRITSDPERLAILRAMKLRSWIIAPLVAHGHAFGALTFAISESPRRYNRDDLALALDLARRAAVAIENAKLLRALRESDHAKDVFMATLAHELRNPLAPIWNGLSIIQRVPGDRQRVAQVTGMIERQVGQLTRLVDDLLDISRIGTGKIDLKKEPVSLARIIGAAVEMSRPQIEAAHHKLSLTFPDEPVEILADPARMAQVFANLLINAAKYTRRGGSIALRAETQPTQVVVYVRDNGTGIAPDMLGRVFGLYTQASHPDERRQGGLGIGLSLVEGLVRLHGGTVEVRSPGLDLGSEFIVALPRLEPGARPPMAAMPIECAVTGGAARRILVVDDNLDAAGSVADLLALYGNEVDVAHDGTGAVEHTRNFRPDVVLLDIGLPDISGYEAARRIRKLAGVRQPTLIALTGWGQQQDKEQSVASGFDHHWTKPVDPARLLALTSR
ncbi:MAG: ATP-binding protein [Pseudomonadota bacterium]